MLGVAPIPFQFAGKRWSSAGELHGRKIPAHLTQLAPQILPGHPLSDRLVVLLYDTSLARPLQPPQYPLCEAARRRRFYLHWMWMCGETVVPYAPMRPPTGKIHNYRLAFYLAPRDCAANPDAIYPYRQRWQRHQMKRTAEWIQCLIDRVQKGEMWKLIESANFQSGFLRGQPPPPPPHIPPAAPSRPAPRRSRRTPARNSRRLVMDDRGF